MITRAVAFLAVFLCVFLVAARASAVPHQTRTSISPDTIEVGDTATLTFFVMPGDSPSDPQVAVPHGVTLTGKMVAPAVQINVSNGQMTQSVSARAIFRVHPLYEGTFTLGAPSIMINGTRITGDRVTLRVVARGTLPRQQPDPLDPFGMFGGSSPFQQFDRDPVEQLEPNYPVDPRFALPTARDTGIFLHATVDKSQVVVGEQITLSVWVYADVTESDPELSDPHEVGTSDFLRQALFNPTTIERTAFARAGTHTFAVALLRKWALFPLHAGDLDITPMHVSIGRHRERESESLKVRVTEPPMEHRPAGYTVGDVGHFALNATVSPREVERGAAVSVVVELSGTGNLPSALTIPVRPNVSWLDPEVKEDLKLLDEKTGGAPDRWGGKRTFSYVVTPKKEGDVDLGEMAVSFFDPRTKTYDVARAALGVIHVKPGAAAPVTDETKVLGAMPAIREALAGVKAQENHLDDSPTFFAWLVMPTALFGIALSTRRVARRFSERAQERKTSPVAELNRRVRALDDAEKTDDARAIDGATIRVVEAGAVAHAGVNVRGVGGETVVDVLTRAGVESEAAIELRDVLEACAAARFSPEGVEAKDAKNRADRARALLSRLAEHGKPPSSSAPMSNEA